MVGQPRTPEQLPPAPRGPTTDLLTTHPTTCDALAILLGHEPTWSQPTPTTSNPLLTTYPTTAEALTISLGLN
ncbi:hypothetical protein F5544_08600 [Nocardia arthritidis]|uniref:Uncharacterized protein n=1 Tax=Nocardia arthritidis TaxID=228602 RepID=A0A6G9Y8S6_9NOCA|nr:hypothetical protein F5544_08600 [Nocardia arthritidis]